MGRERAGSGGISSSARNNLRRGGWRDRCDATFNITGQEWGV